MISDCRLLFTVRRSPFAAHLLKSLTFPYNYNFEYDCVRDFLFVTGRSTNSILFKCMHVCVELGSRRYSLTLSKKIYTPQKLENSSMFSTLVPLKIGPKSVLVSFGRTCCDGSVFVEVVVVVVILVAWAFQFPFHLRSGDGVSATALPTHVFLFNFLLFFM